MQHETTRGTLEERTARLMPSALGAVLAKRSGMAGPPMTDAQIREWFTARHREEMRVIDALGPGAWADNESIASAAWRAFEAAMSDPRAVPECVGR